MNPNTPTGVYCTPRGYCPACWPFFPARQRKLRFTRRRIFATRALLHREYPSRDEIYTVSNRTSTFLRVLCLVSSDLTMYILKFFPNITCRSAQHWSPPTKGERSNNSGREKRAVGVPKHAGFLYLWNRIIAKKRSWTAAGSSVSQEFLRGEW